MDATKPLETEAPVAEAAAPARTGSSSSSSSSDADKKAKKATKNKSRSASRKRASIFGGLLGKKEKVDTEAAAEPEVKKEESVAPQIGECTFAFPT
jgi:hypothetical protein